MKVLITGFEPFGNYTENSSWTVAVKVAAVGIDGVEIVASELPVSFNRVAKVIREEVGKHNTDILLMLGQSAMTDCIKLERVALNMMDSMGADNDGFTPDEEPIYKNASSALFTNVPIKKLCSAIEEEGIKVKISNSCGLYVCNRLYYEALTICNENPSVKAIFVHVPLLRREHKTMDEKETISIDCMVKAVIKSIESLKR